MAIQTPIEPEAPAAQPSVQPNLGPGLLLVVLGVGAAWSISVAIPALSLLVCAVVVGALIGNFGLATDEVQPGLTFAAKKVLRVGVVLLGLRLSLGDVLNLGVETLALVAATVICTFFGTQWLGRRIGLSKELSLLVATGYSICGASAIAAVESSTDAEEEEVAAAIGLVTLFGSLAILTLPIVGALAGLDDLAFGRWVGASVHDVAQVVATASSGGQAVVATAIAVKLTRVAMLAPIVAGVNLQRRRTSPLGVDGTQPPILPLFVVGFLAMVLVRTSGVLPELAIDGIKTIEGWLLAAALVGLGAGVRVDRLRKLGSKPVVLGLMAWVLVAAVSLAGVLVIS